MKTEILFFMTLFALYSCQTLYFFKEQFKLEVSKIKPVIADKSIEKLVTKVAKTYTVEHSHTIKAVDINDVFKTCNLDFEINLANSKILPASDHQIAHIIVGGLIIPGQEYVKRKNDLWRSSVGVVIDYEFGTVPNTVYLLTYDLSVHFDKTSFEQKAGMSLDDIDDRTLASSIFYNALLTIIEKEIEPIKEATKKVVEEK